MIGDAGRLDRLDLLLVGANDVVDAARRGRIEMVGAGAAGEAAVAVGLRRGGRAADQFQRVRPVEAHAALGGVHRLGDGEAEAPEVPAVGDGRVPVDRRRQPRIDVGARIGDDMGRGIGDAIERARRLGRKGARRAEANVSRRPSAVGSFS